MSLLGVWPVRLGECGVLLPVDRLLFFALQRNSLDISDEAELSQVSRSLFSPESRYSIESASGSLKRVIA